MPDEVIDVVSDYIYPIGTIHLDLTAHRYHRFFTQNKTAQLKLTSARKVVNHFFTLVVLGLLKIPARDNFAKLVPVLENLLERYPELLTYRLTITDHQKRKLINRTPYQISLAYAADDIYLMMEKYFLRLPDGEKEMKKQFNEQFPNGIIKAYPKYDIEKALAAFHHATALIKTDRCISYHNDKPFSCLTFLKRMNKDTRQAINEFFSIIESDKEHTIGLVNDMQLYQEGTKSYEKDFNKFIGWPQRNVYCVYMLGGLQALFTPNFLQVLMQGADNVIDQGESLKYVTKIFFEGYQVSPFDPHSPFRLGQHFFLDYNLGAEYSLGLSLFDGSHAWDVFVENKINRLKKLSQKFYSKEEDIEPKKSFCNLF